jgi:hypothetical protein
LFKTLGVIEFFFHGIKKITPLDTEMAKLLEKLVVTGDQSPKRRGEVGTGVPNTYYH